MKCSMQVDPLKHLKGLHVRRSNITFVEAFIFLYNTKVMITPLKIKT